MKTHFSIHYDYILHTCRRKISKLLIAPVTLLALSSAGAAPEFDSAFEQIDIFISEENFVGARQKLSDITARQIRDERIEIYQGRLRLFDSFKPALTAKLQLSAQDTVTATDLFDSLKLAIDNSRIEEIKQFSEPSTATAALIDALLKNYSNIKTRLSSTSVDYDKNSFFATLEFLELTTKSGDTAYPSDAWRIQKLRVTKTNEQWQKVHW